MKKEIPRFSLRLIALTVLIATHANADNYAECLLEKLPGASNQVVTTATVRICSKKYPAMFYGVKYGAGLSIFGFGYSNPDECTADKAKGTQSHSAAALIRSACMRLYTKEEPIDLSTAVLWDDLELEVNPVKAEPVKTPLSQAQANKENKSNTPTAESLAKAIAEDARRHLENTIQADDNILSIRSFSQGKDVILEARLNTDKNSDEQIVASLKASAIPELMSDSCDALEKKGISGSGLRFIYKYFNRDGVLIYSKIIDQPECTKHRTAGKASAPTTTAPLGKNEIDRHYSAIYAAHPDAEKIVESGELAAWISSLKSEWRQQYELTLKEGTTEQVIAMLSSYKASRRNSDGARQVSPIYDIQEQMQKPQSNGCVYKSVMTKADYDACGLTPP